MQFNLQTCCVRCSCIIWLIRLFVTGSTANAQPAGQPFRLHPIQPSLMNSSRATNATMAQPGSATTDPRVTRLASWLQTQFRNRSTNVSSLTVSNTAAQVVAPGNISPESNLELRHRSDGTLAQIRRTRRPNSAAVAAASQQNRGGTMKARRAVFSHGPSI
jgi:hypothetical protein